MLVLVRRNRRPSFSNYSENILLRFSEGRPVVKTKCHPAPRQESCCAAVVVLLLLMIPGKPPQHRALPPLGGATANRVFSGQRKLCRK